jgi:glycosyltransferase involved in cell wall biosynthesis
MQHLIVFCHLRWRFVYQRPQHLLSRLARRWHVHLVEEPLFGEGAGAWLERSEPCPNVSLLTPHTPVPDAGFADAQRPHLKQLLHDYMCRHGITEPVVWFYTPMALPLLDDLEDLDGLDAAAVVYDCMDELSAFKFAPPELAARELALMQRADLVITGGASLYAAKRDLHPNVHCLPSAVDAAHFSPATAARPGPERDEAQRLHDPIGTPRLGYMGVIDERLDLALVAAVADADPAWQVVMVGPVVKIDPAQLPRRPNLHWLGQQPYERLPALVAQWDVCLMPFALNEHTRFISPTKTLEYLAAGKPVVSTPVHDVVALYGQLVDTPADVHGFVQACRRHLGESPAQRQQRQQAAAACVRRHSWDEAARTVSRLLDEAVVAHVADGEPAPALAAAATERRLGGARA